MRIHVDERSSSDIRTSATTSMPSRFDAYITHPDDNYDYDVWLDIRTLPGTGPVICEMRVTQLPLYPEAPRGITTELLRSVKVRELRQRAIAKAQKPEIYTTSPDGSYRLPGDAKGVRRFGTVLRGPGRGRSMDKDHLERVAAVYREAIDAGSREPVEVVREQFHTSRSTAGRWLVQARRVGVLGPATGPVAGEVEQPKVTTSRKRANPPKREASK